ncbi:MAG: hypothetical protein ACYC3S_14240 [Chloroflexota bacterium]
MADTQRKALAAILAVAIIASSACDSAPSPKTTPDSSKPAAATTTGSGKTSSATAPASSKPAFGQTKPDTAVDTLIAPLPAQSPMPQGSPDQAAATLAGLVLKGGEETMPALLTALQAAGFGVRGSDGALLLKPAEPSQGLVFDDWEVRLMVESARHAAFVPLSNLAEVLGSPLEELKGAPMDTFILSGIKAHAQDKPSPLRFWAQFIAELGRQAQGHEQYDLLGRVDPAKVQLDPIQLSLILHRLAGDVYFLSKSPTASASPTKPQEWWGVQTAYAAGTDNLACTLSDTESEILDIAAMGMTTGFGELMGYLDDKGMAKAGKIGKASGYASIVLAYAKLVWVYAAFDLKIELQGSGPLKRTKAMRPGGHGEQRNLAATVKLNIGQAQTLNCFRLMLNSAGLDFDLPNDGPVQGAHVQWRGLDGFNEAAAALHGGPEQIVRFVDKDGNRIQGGGDASTGENAITNQSTDGNGQAFIEVEGVGQREEIGKEATQDKKEEATVEVKVQIQPANLFQDLKDAAGTALGGPAGLLTIPADLMYRTRWAFSGSHTFTVLDWQEAGGWHGTITETTTTKRSDAISTYLETVQQTVTLTGPATIPGMPAGMPAEAQGLGFDMLSGTVSASYQKEYKMSKKDEYNGAFAGAFRKYCTPQVSSQSSTASAQGGGEATVMIILMPGAPASIVVNSQAELVGVEKSENVSNGYDLDDNKGTCKLTVSETKDEVPFQQSLGGINIAPTVDPNNPNVLKGSKTEPSGGDTTTVTTWDLSRN